MSRLWGAANRMPRRIIDVHAHAVPLSRKVPSLFPHLGEARAASSADPPERGEATLSDLLADMDRAQVTASLVVLYEETAEFLRLAAQHPGRLFGLAYYDSRDPREGVERVRTLCDDHPGLVLGVMTAFPYFRQDPRLTDFAPLYACCQERGLPVQFHMDEEAAMAESCRPTAIGVLATRYPELKIVCLHAGGSWHREMPGLLRAFANVFLEVEPLQPVEAEGGEPRILRSLLRAAGSRRLMFGSNWQGRAAEYMKRVALVRRIPWWHRANLSWRTAARVYGPRILSGQPSARKKLSAVADG